MPVGGGTPGDSDLGQNGMQRSYVRVLIVWIVTLLSLYAFQEYFR